MKTENRGRPKTGPPSSTEYEKNINGLIFQANKHANNLIKKEDYPESIHGEDWKRIWGNAWDKVFHDEMDRLAALAGLRGTRKYKKAA